MDVTLCAIGVIMLFFTFISLFKSRNILVGLAASITWIAFLVFTRNNPMIGITTGSFNDQLIVYLCYIMMVVCPLAVIMRLRSDSQMRLKGYDVNGDGQIAGSAKLPDKGEQNIMSMDRESYREHIRERINQGRSRIRK